MVKSRQPDKGASMSIIFTTTTTTIIIINQSIYIYIYFGMFTIILEVFT